MLYELEVNSDTIRDVNKLFFLILADEPMQPKWLSIMDERS